MSAAHAYAMVTGEPQAVVVHVDAGTQNLSGGVNNAMRGRVPCWSSPDRRRSPRKADCPAAAAEFIHWIQDVRDQRGILRGCVKYDNEIHTGRNVEAAHTRALQTRPQRSPRARCTWSARVR